MINILCKHWQINGPEEFGRIFHIDNPTQYYEGKEQLPPSVWARLSTIFTIAQTLDQTEEVAFALQEYLDEHDLKPTTVGSLLDKDPESVRKWLRLESKPSRNSVVRIASLLHSSPLEEEWNFHIRTLKNVIKTLGVSQTRLSEVLGVSSMTVRNWTSLKNSPSSDKMGELLPLIVRYNDAARALCVVVETELDED